MCGRMDASDRCKQARRQRQRRRRRQAFVHQAVRSFIRASTGNGRSFIHQVIRPTIHPPVATPALPLVLDGRHLPCSSRVRGRSTITKASGVHTPPPPHSSSTRRHQRPTHPSTHPSIRPALNGTSSPQPTLHSLTHSLTHVPSATQSTAAGVSSSSPITVKVDSPPPRSRRARRCSCSSRDWAALPSSYSGRRGLVHPRYCVWCGGGGGGVRVWAIVVGTVCVVVVVCARW